MNKFFIKNLSSVIIFCGVFALISSEGCTDTRTDKDLYGPEQEINQGWEDFANQLLVDYTNSSLNNDLEDGFGFHKIFVFTPNEMLLDEYENVFLNSGEKGLLIQYQLEGDRKFSVLNLKGHVVYDELNLESLNTLMPQGYQITEQNHNFISKIKPQTSFVENGVICNQNTEEFIGSNFEKQISNSDAYIAHKTLHNDEPYFLIEHLYDGHYVYDVVVCGALHDEVAISYDDLIEYGYQDAIDNISASYTSLDLNDF